MAIDKMSDHLMMQWARHPVLKTDETARETFEIKFRDLPYTEQHHIMAYMFSNFTEIDHQYWLMTLANTMVKQRNASYRNSEFKSQDTMVEFFIRQYSYGELLQLRTSIWAIMK